MWRISTLLVAGLATAAGAAPVAFDGKVSKAERAAVEKELRYEPALTAPGAKAMLAKVDVNEDGKADFLVKVGKPQACKAEACALYLLIARRGGQAGYMQALMLKAKSAEVLASTPQDVEDVNDLLVDGQRYRFSGKNFYVVRR